VLFFTLKSTLQEARVNEGASASATAAAAAPQPAVTQKEHHDGIASVCVQRLQPLLDH
jgi:hypothetical protein